MNNPNNQPPFNNVLQNTGGRPESMQLDSRQNAVAQFTIQAPQVTSPPVASPGHNFGSAPSAPQSAPGQPYRLAASAVAVSGSQASGRQGSASRPVASQSVSGQRVPGQRISSLNPASACDAGSPQASRRQINHPELLRILMTSETSALPPSLTNPSPGTRAATTPGVFARSATARSGANSPRANMQGGLPPYQLPSNQPMQNAQQIGLQKQLDQEQRQAVRAIAIAAATGVLLLAMLRLCCAQDAVPAGKPGSAPAIVPSPPIKEAVPAPAGVAPPVGAVPPASTATVTGTPSESAIPLSALPPLVSFLGPSERKGVFSTEPMTPSALGSLRPAVQNTPVVTQPAPANPLAALHEISHLTGEAPVTAGAVVHSRQALLTGDGQGRHQQGGVKAPAPTALMNAPAPPSMQEAERLNALFSVIGTCFWRAERQIQGDATPEGEQLSATQRLARYLPPLEQPAAQVQDYHRAQEAAAEFVGLADRLQLRDERLAPALYLGGLASYTLGYKGRALEFLQRLRLEYPHYRREAYSNERMEPDAAYAQPTAPGVSKLIFALQLQELDLGNKPSRPRDAFGTLQQVTSQAGAAFHAQQQYKVWLATRPSKHDRRMLDESRLGPEPDQRRASALPTSRSLIDGVYASLMPAALRQTGTKKMREYLRGLIAPESSAEVAGPATLASSTVASATMAAEPPGSASASATTAPTAIAPAITPVLTTTSTPEVNKLEVSKLLAPLPVAVAWDDVSGWAVSEVSPLCELARRQLIAIDDAILSDYRKQVARLTAQSNWNGARALLRTVIAEYPGTPAAHMAQAEIQNLTARAIQAYRAEGDKRFNPAGQINVPQSEARAYFEKMYKEDPDGFGADYALLQWSRALGTEGNLQQASAQLKELSEKFPDSEYLAQAKYLVGLYLGHVKLRKYEEAIACLEQVAAEHPDSPEAPEALWHAAYFSYLSKVPEKGGKYLDQLQSYTGSPRYRHIGELRKLLTP